MDERENIIFTEKPVLRNPYMVCGIAGWVDGGEAASGSARYLVRKLEAKCFAEIPINKFHIFQAPGQLSLRPHIKMENGLIKEHRFPRNRFYYWKNPDGDNDLIIFRGTEPNLNWEEYANAILGVIEDFNVIRVYSLGGVLDKMPHTREPAISCSCTSENLREEMRKYCTSFSNYEGPGRFSTTLMYYCTTRKIEMATITARATYYPEFDIVIPHNPKTIRAIIKRLNHQLRLNMDISNLDRQAVELEEKLNFMATQNPKLQVYIRELEKEYPEDKYEEPLEMSGDEAVRLAEEFLKGTDED
ncbi:PAC2 family protein [Chloroflexota bacterium]